MIVEDTFASWDVHSTESEFKNSYPGVVFWAEDISKIGYTVHKWETENPKGKFLAICDISNQICNDCDFDVSDIEQGEKIELIHVFKYHASKWRPVEWKKKWTYKSKDAKNHIFRIVKKK